MPSIIKDGAQKRGATFTLRSQGGMPIVDERYSWIVLADSPLVPVNVILSTPGIPKVNVTQSPNGLGICRSKSGEQWKENPLYWTVSAEFSSMVDERSTIQDPAVNPVTWVPIYETKFERLQEVVTKDKAGKAIANSAGQPFETGLTISRFIPVWEFFQIENPITDEELIERNETVNQTQFKGRAPDTLLLTVMSSVVGFYYGQRRRLTQYSVKYNERKWTHKRLDVGNVYKLSTKLVPYTDDNGNVILGGLNGFGAKVPFGEPPAVLNFDMYNKLNFNTFLRV